MKQIEASGLRLAGWGIRSSCATGGGATTPAELPFYVDVIGCGSLIDRFALHEPARQNCVNGQMEGVAHWGERPRTAMLTVV